MLARIPPRYQISTLDWDDQDVFLTVGEEEVIGRIRFTSTGKPRFQIRKSRTSFEDLPKQALVALWRPLDMTRWPHELPEAATLTPNQDIAIAEPTEAAGGDFEDDGAHVAGLYLGRPGETPGCLDETKVRLIRCIRTRSVIERQVILAEVYWPKPWLDEAQVRHKQLAASPSNELVGWRKEDYDDVFVDISELNARPARFVPTPRDVSDYEANIDREWLRMISKYDRWIFQARAKLPPFEWWQIADEVRLDEHVVREIYQDCLQTIFEKVRSQ